MRDGHPLRVRAEAHISAMSRRTSADHDQLAQILQVGSWPGGTADRTGPAGRDWARRWARACPHTAVPECTCAEGRCAVCN
jgi:hypothetical protein